MSSRNASIRVASLAASCLALVVLLWAALPATAASPRTAVSKDATRLPECSWDRPGHNPFMGDVVAAVDRYTDIPADVRGRLKQRMARREYDDVASIRRDSVEGKARYKPAIRDMHFGTGRVCSTVSRRAWLPTHQERGLVYCEGAECIIVPTVCRNVSRIQREEPAALASRDLLAPVAAPPGDELLFEPPGAGEPRSAAVSVPESFAAHSGDLERHGSAGAPQGLGGFDGFAAPAPGPGGEFGLATGTAEPGARVHLAAGGRLADSGASPPPAIAPLPGSGSTAVAAVPEPQTWALMLLGLGACVLRATRRRIEPHALRSRR